MRLLELFSHDTKVQKISEISKHFPTFLKKKGHKKVKPLCIPLPRNYMAYTLVYQAYTLVYQAYTAAYKPNNGCAQGL